MRGKKYFLYIISLLLAINFAACKTDNKKQSAGKEIEKSFDIKAAENIVNSYMNYLMKEDYQNVSRFYSKEISKNIPKINEPYASLEEYILKVIKEDTDYKISDVNTSIDKEAFLKNGRLRIRSKNNVDTNLLIDPGGIPNYAFSKDDKAKTDKIEVSKKNYGPMIFSYSGYSIAISTYEKDSFAGIIKIDESMAVQGGQKDDQSQQGGSTGGEKGATGLVKEKPVGKEFTALDLLKNSKIDYMVFSGDEKFLLIQYSKDGYGKSIGLYHSEGGEMIPYEFEKNYPIDKVDIIFSSFDKEALNFEVVPRAGADKSVGEYIGRWRMDLKEFRVKKM